MRRRDRAMHYTNFVCGVARRDAGTVLTVLWRPGQWKAFDVDISTPGLDRDAVLFRHS